jgi:thiol-disulfide isomerase/thioredoxin
MSITKQIISNIPNRDEFFNLLQVNPGLIVIKMGSNTWCKPCRTIKPIVEAFFASSPMNVLCCDIDVDECFDLYSFMKQKRMVNGVPVMMLWKKGNTTFIPDDSVTGAEPQALDAFFKRCGLHLLSVSPAVLNKEQKKN